MTDGGKPIEAGTGVSEGADVPGAAVVPLRAPAGTVAAPGNGADGEPVLNRKPGRPKGSPKVPGSGRRKGKPNALGRAAREYLAAESGYLDMIARVCAGKAVRMSGPTGKKSWYHPDWADRKWAVELVSSKCIPTMSAAEVTGADGEPLFEPTRRGKLSDTMEAAININFALRKGEEAAKELAKMDAPEPEPKPAPEPKMVPEAPEPPAEPTEPPLPKHPFIYIEEGERERSGTRAWLVFEGRDILNILHGADARQKARAWVATKYNASPCEEIEVPLPEEEEAK